MPSTTRSSALRAQPAAPPAAPPARPQPASFASLPAELKLHTLRLAVPDLVNNTTHTYIDQAYLERQKTLSRLCLVSSSFRLFAQPMLEEAVFADYKAWDAFFEIIGRKSSEVRFVKAGWPRKEEWKRLVELLPLCKELRHLRLVDMNEPDMDLALIWQHKHLESLVLAGRKIMGFPSQPVLFSLTRLELSGSGQGPCDLAAAVSACPALRDLRLRSFATVDLQPLQDAKDLRFLDLQSVELIPLANFRLPHLHQLLLDDIAWPAQPWDNLFSTATFPRLRVLAYPAAPRAWENLPAPPPLQPDLALQLHIFVDSNLETASLDQTLAGKTLKNLEFGDLDKRDELLRRLVSETHYIRVYDRFCDAPKYQDIYRAFDRFGAVLRDTNRANVRLKRIYFPTYFSHVISLSDNAPTAADSDIDSEESWPEGYEDELPDEAYFDVYEPRPEHSREAAMRDEFWIIKRVCEERGVVVDYEDLAWAEGVGQVFSSPKFAELLS
ncbi:hypothetical protein JCM8097_004514 [Rhodosporidiobolus ruineniae]